MAERLFHSNIFLANKHFVLRCCFGTVAFSRCQATSVYTTRAGCRRSSDIFRLRMAEKNRPCRQWSTVPDVLRVQTGQNGTLGRLTASSCASLKSSDPDLMLERLSLVRCVSCEADNWCKSMARGLSCQHTPLMSKKRVNGKGKQ